MATIQVGEEPITVPGCDAAGGSAPSSLVLALAACAADDAGDRSRGEQEQPQDRPRPGDDERDGGESPAPTSPVAEIADPGPVTCPPATVTVGTADELQEALDAAAPGDVIASARHATTASSWPRRPATPDAADLPLRRARRRARRRRRRRRATGCTSTAPPAGALVGFTVSNAQKGVMVDGGVGHVIQGLHVEHIGDEAIHLRAFSTDNVVRGNDIHDTGLRRDKFGEGVYVGQRREQLVHASATASPTAATATSSSATRSADTTVGGGRHQGGHDRRRACAATRFDGVGHDRPPTRGSTSRATAG